MDNVTLDQILSMAEQLTPIEQAMLLEHLQPAPADETHNDADLREWGMMIDQMCGCEADDPM